MPRHEPQHLPQAIADLNAAFAVLCKGDAFIFLANYDGSVET